MCPAVIGAHMRDISRFPALTTSHLNSPWIRVSSTSSVPQASLCCQLLPSLDRQAHWYGLNFLPTSSKLMTLSE